MRVLISTLLSICFAGAANATSVGTDHGNIVLNGKAVTSGGRDSDPVLSPDGRRVVFLRLGTGPALNDCAADATTSRPLELWSIAADGSGAKRLLALRSDPDVKKTLCAFDNLQFSSNGRLLYFETPAWATSGAVHVYDFAAGRARFFLAGNGAVVLNACRDRRYRDDVIVSQHRYFVFSGSYDWDFLFTPAGVEVGPLGDGDHKTDIEDACG
ncbi:MAG TPA: hypothetical protein VNU97_17065 [Rhizomicrobium sp.]|jgi:hypothetical protein|nr:hypothetical protein [Rhizomicrobium sp.]